MIANEFHLASIRGVFRFFWDGGYFMGLLLVCSVVAVTVIILRSLALRRHLVISPAMESEIDRLNPNGPHDAINRIEKLCKHDTSTMSRIAGTALSHMGLPKDENQNAVQTVARHEVVKLESGLHILEIVIGIAPLLGLLGAVSGLVQVFGAFGSSSSQHDPNIIAKGISEALSTTVVGIAIAIPSLIAYSLLAKRVETLAADMELMISGLISKCYHMKQRNPGRGLFAEVES